MYESAASYRFLSSMQVSGETYSLGAIAATLLLYAAFLGLAMRLADWRRLFDNEQSNVFFGALVGILVLWILRTDVVPGLVFHLSGIPALTLMFGWSLTVIGGSLVLAGITLAGLSDWSGFPFNALFEVVLPATLTQTLLVLVRSMMPRHFFVYIFINAFLAGGVVAVISALATCALLATAGLYSLTELQSTVFPFFPLMFLPEAFLNGWIMTLLVVFKPHWVSSFRDEDYLHGK